MKFGTVALDETVSERIKDIESADERMQMFYSIYKNEIERITPYLHNIISYSTVLDIYCNKPRYSYIRKDDSFDVVQVGINTLMIQFANLYKPCIKIHNYSDEYEEQKSNCLEYYKGQNSEYYNVDDAYDECWMYDELNTLIADLMNSCIPTLQNNDDFVLHLKEQLSTTLPVVYEISHIIPESFGIADYINESIYRGTKESVYTICDDMYLKFEALLRGEISSFSTRDFMAKKIGVHPGSVEKDIFVPIKYEPDVTNRALYGEFILIKKMCCGYIIYRKGKI